MKRMLCVLAAVAVSSFAVGALAETPAGQAKAGTEAAKSEAKAEPKSVTLKGEVVDTGCFLSHGASGEKHKGCASKCIAGGMPMALLTSDGDLYLLTMNHKNADPYHQCKEWAAAIVEVTGPTFERNGMKAIEVLSAKSAAAAVAPAK